MTEGKWDSLLTGVQAHCSATAEEAGDLAALAIAMRQTADSALTGVLMGKTMRQWASTLERLAVQRAAGLERLTRLVGDIRGDTLDDTVPISRDELAAANSEDP